MLYYDSEFKGIPKLGDLIWLRAIGIDRATAVLGGIAEVSTSTNAVLHCTVVQVIAQTVQLRVDEITWR